IVPDAGPVLSRADSGDGGGSGTSAGLGLSERRAGARALTVPAKRSGSLFRSGPASSASAREVTPELPEGRIGFCEGEARGKGPREFSHSSEPLGIDSKRPLVHVQPT